MGKNTDKNKRRSHEEWIEAYEEAAKGLFGIPPENLAGAMDPANPNGSFIIFGTQTGRIYHDKPFMTETNREWKPWPFTVDAEFEVVSSVLSS